MKPFTVLIHAALLWSLHAAALAQKMPTDSAHQAQVAQDMRTQRVADANKHWSDVVAGRRMVLPGSRFTVTFTASRRPDQRQLTELLQAHGLRIDGVFFQSAEVDGVYGFDVDPARDLPAELRRVQDELAQAQASVDRVRAKMLGGAAAAVPGVSRITDSNYCGMAVRGDVSAVESLRKANPGLVLMVKPSGLTARTMPLCEG